jgi:hypothetical protein
VIPASNVAGFLRREFATQECLVAAYWAVCSDSRQHYCDELQSLTADLPILPIPVEKRSFEDPDGVQDDLVAALSSMERWFTADRRSQIESHRKIMVVLVSRRRLRIPQLSSPCALPQWFPLWPGHELNIKVDSLEIRARFSLDDSSFETRRVNEALMALETAIQRVLRGVIVERRVELPPRSRSVFFGDDRNLDFDTLAKAEEALRLVTSPSAFRPSGDARSAFMVSKIYRLWWRTRPDDLHELSKNVATALCIYEKPINRNFSLLSLLVRPFEPKLSETADGVVFARNLIVSIVHAMQVSTACAHAGDYPQFQWTPTASYFDQIAASCSVSAADLVSTITES